MDEKDARLASLENVLILAAITPDCVCCAVLSGANVRSSLRDWGEEFRVVQVNVYNCVLFA